MKTLHLILAGLFVLFALVQINDEDGWKWMVLYLFIAGILAYGAWERRDRNVIGAAIGLAGIWFLTLIPDFIEWVRMGMPTIVSSMTAEAPHIELTREFLGLLISLAALIWQYRLAPGSESPDSEVNRIEQ